MYFQVALVTFASFVLMDEKNVLDAEKAFASLSLFNILQFPFTVFPMLIVHAVQVSISVVRIRYILLTLENIISFVCLFIYFSLIWEIGKSIDR